MATTYYRKLFSVSWQSDMSYPLSIFLWRFRVLLSAVMSLSLWSVIYSSSGQIFGYDRSQMMTYMFLTGVLQSIILATALHGLAENIYTGAITNLLLQPVKVFRVLFIYDLADKTHNFFLTIIETIALFFIYKPDITLPNLTHGLFFLGWCVAAVFINFFISLIFGGLGFWTRDVWAPKFLFLMIVEFTSGRLFPIDILPQSIQTILGLTPFPYLSYFQTQIFLNKIPDSQIWPTSLVIIFWCVALGLVVKKMWGHGFRNYEATGK